MTQLRTLFFYILEGVLSKGASRRDGKNEFFALRRKEYFL